MYYDMSGFDYGILDVVQVLHLRKRRGNYYDCPFCGETHGKLNINVEKNVFRCNRCDSSGGMLKLYADLHNVTLSEANQQIREALGKGEYRTDYIKATPVQEEKATAELAPIEEIHRTYQRMLSMLTLNRKHQEDLQRRGLKPEQIEAQRYRSVPLFGMKKLVKRLAEEGYMVKGVPGFYRDTDGNWTINFKAENSGILIPIVSLDGFIQGFHIRVDHVTDTKKYILLLFQQLFRQNNFEYIHNLFYIQTPPAIPPFHPVQLLFRTLPMPDLLYPDAQFLFPAPALLQI